MVAPIVQTGAEIGLMGLKIFSEERRRYLSKRHLELRTNLDMAKKATGADYTDVAVVDAKVALNDFLLSYASEFDEALEVLMKGVKVV